MTYKAVFLDSDVTVIEDVNYLSDIEQVTNRVCARSYSPRPVLGRHVDTRRKPRDTIINEAGEVST